MANPNQGHLLRFRRGSNCTPYSKTIWAMIDKEVCVLQEYLVGYIHDWDRNPLSCRVRNLARLFNGQPSDFKLAKISQCVWARHPSKLQTSQSTTVKFQEASTLEPWKGSRNVETELSFNFDHRLRAAHVQEMYTSDMPSAENWRCVSRELSWNRTTRPRQLWHHPLVWTE